MTKLNYEELAEHFAIHNFKYKIGGEPRIPTADDLKNIVEESIEHLKSVDDFATLSVGRLRIEKAGELYGVYTFFGDA